MYKEINLNILKYTPNRKSIGISSFFPKKKEIFQKKKKISKNSFLIKYTCPEKVS